MHSHGSEVISRDCHLHYVHSGGFTAVVENKHYHLDANSIYYSPKGTVYHFEVDAEHQQNTLLTSLNFDFGCSECSDTKLRIPTAYTPDTTIDRDPLFDIVNQKESFLGDVKIFPNAKKYQPYFSGIMKEFQLSSTYGRDLTSCMLKELIILLHSAPDNTSLREAEFINEILLYINDNYTKPIDNKSIASYIGYHPNYLGRLFKQYMHTSIHQYILSLRLSEAKNLICGTTLSFTEISAKAGFDDYAYFSAYFKKKSGMSPSDYRKYHINII